VAVVDQEAFFEVGLPGPAVPVTSLTFSSRVN
jgi:hypothetical protein